MQHIYACNSQKFSNDIDTSNSTHTNKWMIQTSDNKTLMCDQHKFNMNQLLVKSKRSTEQVLIIKSKDNPKADISNTNYMVELGEQA